MRHTSAATPEAAPQGPHDFAAEHGHDDVVLGALGCGVWGCPPRHVAQIFADVLNRDFYFGATPLHTAKLKYCGTPCVYQFTVPRNRS